jgi:DNA-binding transcriptional LysR family regulator
MKSLRLAVPSSSALVVFEAAARHQHFTRAAAELNVTQAAVSRQVQALEDRLGVLLFRRDRRRLQLTAEGRRLHAAVAMGLGHIASVMESIRRPHASSQVTVTTSMAMAAMWLTPRLACFTERAPDISIRILASDPNLDLAAEGIDLGIRFGAGSWPGLDAVPFMPEIIFPVCSPRFLESHRDIRAVADLQRGHLLHLDELVTTNTDWLVWLTAVGLEPPRREVSLRFNNYPMLIQAALAGQGMALGSGVLVQDLLASGALARPFPETVLARNAFWLVAPRSPAMGQAAGAFRDWLREEAAATEARLGIPEAPIRSAL